MKLRDELEKQLQEITRLLAALPTPEQVEKELRESMAKKPNVSIFNFYNPLSFGRGFKSGGYTGGVNLNVQPGRMTTAQIAAAVEGAARRAPGRHAVGAPTPAADPGASAARPPEPVSVDPVKVYDRPCSWRPYEHELAQAITRSGQAALNRLLNTVLENWQKQTEAKPRDYIGEASDLLINAFIKDGKKDLAIQMAKLTRKQLENSTAVSLIAKLLEKQADV